MGENHIIPFILAAGMSTRYGNGNKLLVPVKGQSVLRHAIHNMHGAGYASINLCVGHEEALIRSALENEAYDINFVSVENYKKGQGESIKQAANHVLALAKKEKIDGFLIALGDMPCIKSKTIQHLSTIFIDNGAKKIVRPVFNDGIAEKIGHPVFFPISFAEKILLLSQDKGAKEIIASHHNETIYVPCLDEGIIIDLDEEADFLQWK